MAWTKKESELAAVLVDDLQGRGWEVYQEVEVAGSVADLVATQGRVVWAIETKISLSLVVLGQAHRWLGLAHLVSAAVAPARHSVGRGYALASAEAMGVGILEVHSPKLCGSDWARKSPVYERVRSSFVRRVSPRLGRDLREEHKTFAAAGNAEGRRYTPFAATCDEIRLVLRRHGPMTVRELVENLHGRHHYASEASARGSVYKWAKAGVIKGVELKDEPGLAGDARHGERRAL
jgi:hypothetical protein